MLARRRLGGHIEEEVRGVFAGIDTHKDTLAVAVIDAASRLLVGRGFPNSEDGFRQLVRLFDIHQVVRVGIEGSGNFGRAVAVHLAVCWQIDRDLTVVEVPTLMTSRERRDQLGKGQDRPG
jgi:transposase